MFIVGHSHTEVEVVPHSYFHYKKGKGTGVLQGRVAWVLGLRAFKGEDFREGPRGGSQ